MFPRLYGFYNSTGPWNDYTVRYQSQILRRLRLVSGAIGLSAVLDYYAQNRFLLPNSAFLLFTPSMYGTMLSFYQSLNPRKPSDRVLRSRVAQVERFYNQLWSLVAEQGATVKSWRDWETGMNAWLFPVDRSGRLELSKWIRNGDWWKAMKAEFDYILRGLKDPNTRKLYQFSAWRDGRITYSESFNPYGILADVDERYHRGLPRACYKAGFRRGGVQVFKMTR